MCIRDSVIAGVHRRDVTRALSNYQEVSVTNSTSELYGKLIKARIENQYEDIEKQNGFVQSSLV